MSIPTPEPGRDSFHLGIMAVLALCRVHCSNIQGFLHGNEYVIKDLNQPVEAQIIYSTVSPPLAYESQLQQVKDSMTAARLIDYLKQSGRLTDGVSKGS